MNVGMILAIVGAVSLVGYIVWLIVCVVRWDSKIPAVIGILLSVVMVLGGLLTMPGFLDKIPIPEIPFFQKDASPEPPAEAPEGSTTE